MIWFTTINLPVGLIIRNNPSAVIWRPLTPCIPILRICYRRAVQSINVRCKLGLTATMVREDDLIHDLHELVGPILYEANWMDLTQQGYLANVRCIEAWCPLTDSFQRVYSLPSGAI